MQTEEKKPEEQLRNPMTTRWTDADFALVADTAWSMRVSTSELVRRLVLAGLKKDAPMPEGAAVAAVPGPTDPEAAVGEGR